VVPDVESLMRFDGVDEKKTSKFWLRLDRLLSQNASETEAGALDSVMPKYDGHPSVA